MTTQEQEKIIKELRNKIVKLSWGVPPELEPPSVYLH